LQPCPLHAPSPNTFATSTGPPWNETSTRTAVRSFATCCQRRNANA
jgi:hypothetical protein